MVKLYSMTDYMMYRLYYQNHKLGFHFMRMIVGRLQRDIAREQFGQHRRLITAIWLGSRLEDPFLVQLSQLSALACSSSHR